jgi:hypothetical protein
LSKALKAEALSKGLKAGALRKGLKEMPEGKNKKP